MQATPDLLMSGLDHLLMHRCLDGIAERIVNGLRLAPEGAIEDVLAGVPVAVERVNRPRSRGDGHLAGLVPSPQARSRRNRVARPEERVRVAPPRSGASPAWPWTRRHGGTTRQPM
ncbi:DUF4262 domain-containing protein [Nocardioides ferulae]|uniref:DUF4262 domain-containing protein n=1 Tax=Nocardioides ferulae TaxID=2340821 RepID=UPI003B84996C